MEDDAGADDEYAIAKKRIKGVGDVWFTKRRGC
jgi:hypothetical protein